MKSVFRAARAGPVRRRLLRRIPAVRPAGARSRPDGRRPGLTVIRVGESVWSTWEPEDGRFELDWLAPVLDGAHARGIKVILGTPTYAMPPWLVRKYPEVTAERKTGAPNPVRPPPGRRLLARRVPLARRPDRAQGRRPLRRAPGRHRLPGRQRARHGALPQPRGVRGLRRHACGRSTRTSRRSTASGASSTGRTAIARWDELWTPDGNTVPSYDLAWRRYQSQITTDFIAAQADIVRELARPDQFVTTCMALQPPGARPARLNRASLDVAAVNPYYPMQDALTMPEAPRRRPDSSTGRATRAPWAIHFSGRPHLRRAAAAVPRDRDQRALDRRTRTRTSPRSTASGARRRGRSWRAAPGWSSTGIGTRSTTAMSSTGSACSITTASRAAATTRSSGSRATSPRAGDTVVGLEPHADVALLYSRESKWAMEFQPPLATDDGAPDRGSYERIFTAFYEGLFGAGVRGRDPLRAGLRRDRASGADRPRPLRRRRRAAGPARRLRGGRRAPRAGLPRRLRRRGGAPAHGHAARAADRGRGRDLRRVHEPHRPGARERRLRWRRHGLGRRTATNHRRGARALRAPASRTLAGDHHPRAREGPSDVRRHPPGPRTRGRARALAASESGRLGGPTENGYGHERTRSGGGTRAFCVELVVGAGAAGDAGRGDRCAVRIRSRFRRGPWFWEHGTSGCSWRGPRRRTTRRGDLLRNTDRHDSARWRALLVALCLGIAALVAACGEQRRRRQCQRRQQRRR